MRVHPAIVTLARVVLGAMLVVTGALKVGHATDLAAAIAGFRLLPAEVIAPLAVILPIFEIVLGVYLLVGLFTRIAGWVASVQFALYAGAIASAVVRGIPANCGCFGPNDQATADWPHVVFDLALAALALIIALRGPGRFAIDGRFNAS